MTPAWTTEVGSLSTRAELVEKYGGSRYPGIAPATASGNILLFSDPLRGTKYGYNFDGPGEDESYYYTGQGAHGHQSLSGNNGSVLAHETLNRALRLFVADGFDGKTETKLQRYVGQFRIDPIAPYSQQPAPDVSGAERDVLVFHLLPVGDTALKDLNDDNDAPRNLMVARMVAPEIDSSLFYESSGSEPGVADKLESELVQSFRAWLGHPSYAVKRWAIRVPGTRSSLLSDIYDTTTKVLYEAKSSSSRRDVRMAVGQLLDYQRHIPVPGLACSLLLPAKPSDDLVDLAHYAHMGVTYRTAEGAFQQQL